MQYYEITHLQALEKMGCWMKLGLTAGNHKDEVDTVKPAETGRR